MPSEMDLLLADLQSKGFSGSVSDASYEYLIEKVGGSRTQSFAELLQLYEGPVIDSRLDSPVDSLSLSYIETVLEDNPDVFWPLNAEGYGDDVSGNNRHLTLDVSDIAWSDSLLASEPDSVSLRGGAEIARAAWMEGWTSISWEFWYRIPVASVGVYALLGPSNAGGFGNTNNNQYRTYMSSGDFVSQLFNSAGNIAAPSPTAVGSYNDGLPHHFLFTFDGTDWEVSIDNTLVVATSGVTTLCDPATLPFYVGRFAANNKFFNAGATAGISHIAVYNNLKLSDERREAHYLAGSTP